MTGVGGPTELVSVDGWSGRYTGEIILPTTGTWKLRASDDGVRVWVDDRVVSEDWFDHGPRFSPVGAEANPVAGTRHRIQVEYYDQAGGATLRL